MSTANDLSTVLVFRLSGHWETRKSSCRGQLGIVTGEGCVAVRSGVASEDQILLLLLHNSCNSSWCVGWERYLLLLQDREKCEKRVVAQLWVQTFGWQRVSSRLRGKVFMARGCCKAASANIMLTTVAFIHSCSEKASSKGTWWTCGVSPLRFPRVCCGVQRVWLFLHCCFVLLRDQVSMQAMFLHSSSVPEVNHDLLFFVSRL